MKRCYLFMIVFISSTILARAAEIKVMRLQGNVLMRHKTERNWETVLPGMILEKQDCIRSLEDSRAEIKVSPGKVFHLPANAMVDVVEIKPYSNSELLLILTALEISRLPAQQRTLEQPSGAFVIHGRQSTSDDSVRSVPYLKFELNGLNALMDQSFWHGVILKIFKLQKFGKLVNQEQLQYQLILAYFQLNFVSRFEQEKKRFIQRFPNSKFIEKIEKF